MKHVACESKISLCLGSSMHPCPGNCMPTGRVVIYYARAAHAFSAGIKCRHSMVAKS